MQNLSRKAPAVRNAPFQYERRTGLCHCDEGMMLERPRIGQRLSRLEVLNSDIASLMK